MKASLYHPIKAGNLTIPGNILAAPMAGYTDRVCRALALEGGAALAWTEMISAEALNRGSGRTEGMMQRADGENLLAVQLFGSDPETLGRASAKAKSLGADLLDLNAGCPVPKVVNKGAGSGLSRDIARLKACVEAMAAAGLPVSVKIRSGWDENEVNWREAARAALDAGAVMLGFHPRTRKQGYGGRSDWDLITRLVEMAPVPVIGSGDLVSPEAARDMLEQTGCAGLMFARGGVGNPQIYHRTRSLLESGDPPPVPAKKERLETARRHLVLAAEAFGEEIAGREMKKHLAGYVKGWESAAELRNTLVRSPDYAELLSKLDEAAVQAGESSR